MNLNLEQLKKALKGLKKIKVDKKSGLGDVIIIDKDVDGQIYFVRGNHSTKARYFPEVLDKEMACTPIELEFNTFKSVIDATGGEEVKLKMNGKRFQVGGGEFIEFKKINSLEESNFLEQLEDTDPTISLNVPTMELCKSMLFTDSEDVLFLSSTRVSSQDNVLMIEATDGYRTHWVYRNKRDRDIDKGEILVPREALNVLHSIQSKDEETEETIVEMNESHVFLTYGDFDIKTRIKPGQYPELKSEELFDEELINELRFLFPKDKYVLAHKLLDSFKPQTNIIELNIIRDWLKFSATNAIGTAKADMEIQFDKPENILLNLDINELSKSLSTFGLNLIRTIVQPRKEDYRLIFGDSKERVALLEKKLT